MGGQGSGPSISSVISIQQRVPVSVLPRCPPDRLAGPYTRRDRFAFYEQLPRRIRRYADSDPAGPAQYHRRTPAVRQVDRRGGEEINPTHRRPATTCQSNRRPPVAATVIASTAAHLPDPSESFPSYHAASLTDSACRYTSHHFASHMQGASTPDGHAFLMHVPYAITIDHRVLSIV